MERLNELCGGPKVSAELKWSSSLPGAQAQAVDAFTVPLRSSFCDFSQTQGAEEEWDSVSLRSAWKVVCLGELCCAPGHTCPLTPASHFPLSFPEPLGCRRPRAPRVILEPANPSWETTLSGSSSFKGTNELVSVCR